jgi:hypothetical protein
MSNASSATLVSRLDLQINLLAEYELTRVPTLVDRLAKKFELADDGHTDLEELKQDVKPAEVLQELETITRGSKSFAAYSPWDAPARTAKNRRAPSAKNSRQASDSPDDHCDHDAGRDDARRPPLTKSSSTAISSHRASRGFEFGSARGHVLIAGRTRARLATRSRQPTPAGHARRPE